MVGLAAFITISVCAGICLWRRPKDLLEPIWGMAVLTILFFALRPVSLAYGAYTRLEAEFHPSDLAWTSLMGALAFAAFYWGYSRPWGKRMAVHLPYVVGVRRRRLHIVLFVYLLAGTLSAAALISRVGWEVAYNQPIMLAFAAKSGLGYALVGINLVSIGFYILVALRLFDRKVSPSVVWLVLWFFAAILMSMLFGLRMEIAKVLLVPVILWICSRYRRVHFRKIIVAGCAGLVFFWFAIVGLQQFRTRGTDISVDVLADARNSWQTFSSGLEPFDCFTFLVHRISEGTSPLWGSSYLRLLLVPIPRSVWPDKPVTSVEGRFTAAFFSDPYEGTNPTYTLTIPGELYWQFPVLGVVLGMSVLGMFMRVIFEYRLLRRHDWLPNLLLVYVSVVIFKGFYASFEGLLVTIVTLGTAIALSCAYACEIRKPSAAERRPGAFPA